MKIPSRYKPIFYYKNEIFFSKGNKIYKKENDLLSFQFKLPSNKVLSLFAKSRLLTRLLRLDVLSSCVFDDKAYIALQGDLYECNLLTYEVTSNLKFEKGRGPVNFAEVRDLDSFEDGVYFGEYFMNPNFEEVSIFRKSDNKWEKVYTFDGKYKINHIHSIIPDKKNDCLWILVGDFGDAAAIYKAHDNFLRVEPVVQGNQIYRGVVAFPHEKGLVYSTDSQFIENSVRLLSYQDNTWVSKKLYGINGPSIYGCELKDYYIFSSSTEPGEESFKFIKDMLDTNPGPGILENKSVVYKLSKDLKQFEILKSNPKDLLPFRLFQFGSIAFPHGKNNSNTLYSFNIACRQNDLGTEVINLDRL